MSSPPSVILYRYDASPFSVKVENILLLKNIPYQQVNVAPVLPRPEITNLLGLTYRRIPILAIGNDIYCDSSLIASVLERRFAPSRALFGTIFPPKKHGGNPETGLLKAFCKHYVDTLLFSLAPVLLPWEKMPASFIEDRSTLMGPINVQAISASRGKHLSALSAQLTLINEQLQDNREWLFDTELPSLADIAVHFIFNWIRSFRNAETLFDESRIPYVLKWLDRVNKHLATLKKYYAPPQPILGTQAASLIASSPYEHYDVVGFDTVEAARLGVQREQIVSMTPDDTGPRFATTGKLVALNQEEFVIEVQGTAGVFRCHFPRIGFTAKLFKNKL